MIRRRILRVFLAALLAGTPAAYGQETKDVPIFSVTEFGTKGDGETLDTQAIQRALDALRDTGQQLAFATFTFDPSSPGSVVIVPDSVARTNEIETSPVDIPRGHAVSDGGGDWEWSVGEAVAAIEAGRVEKVVLARQVEVQFEAVVPQHAVARNLRSANQDCYTFLVDGLVGASPELLVGLRGEAVSSLALAGTAPGGSEGGLSSARMTVEHELAADSVAHALGRHTSSLSRSGRHVADFGSIRHLATRFDGLARSGTTVMDLVASLHPTAAVAGSPQDEALDLIRDLEPKPRGRYAGPVGWFDANGDGEFAIALRCGQITGSSATLYAGAGLVRGSDPDQELAETNLKLRPMLDALGIERLED